jgi:hypothetical protein
MDDIEQLRKWRRNIPDIFRGKFRRQWESAIARKSMRAAVDVKCADCTNWQNVEIRECPVICCPLWAYRPLQNEQRAKTVRMTVETVLAN